jgi:hypothetical protein
MIRIYSLCMSRVRHASKARRAGVWACRGDLSRRSLDEVGSSPERRRVCLPACLVGKNYRTGVAKLLTILNMGYVETNSKVAAKRKRNLA